MLIIGGTYFLLTEEGHTDDWHIVDLSELSIDYKNFAMVNPNGHDVMTYPDPPKESVNLNIKTNILTYGYWDSTVESWTTDSQYRAIGLETRLGVHVSTHLDLGIYHHSQHELDRGTQLNLGHFPEEDAVELKIYLYREATRQTLF